MVGAARSSRPKGKQCRTARERLASREKKHKDTENSHIEQFGHRYPQKMSQPARSSEKVDWIEEVTSLQSV